MTTILQLHWLPIENPSNGTEVRVRKTAEHFGRFGTVHTLSPTSTRRVTENVIAHRSGNIFFRSKLSRIYAWYGSLVLGPNNPFDRFSTWFTLQDVAIDPDLLLVEGPQTMRAGLHFHSKHGTPMIANFHNAWHNLLSEQLEPFPVPDAIADRMVENLRSLEWKTIDAAAAVVFQSEEDRAQYVVPEDTTAVTIPNGADLDSHSNDPDTDAFAANYGLDEDDDHFIYVGSYDYGPNREAATIIAEEIAPAIPNGKFLLVGRNPVHFEQSNVESLGFVEEFEAALAFADVALCPLRRGSGTKLKMFDYLAAGLPTVTTQTGVAGIRVDDGVHVLVRDVNAFPAAIEKLRGDASLREKLSKNAVERAESYSWSNVLSEYDPIVEELIARC